MDLAPGGLGGRAGLHPGDALRRSRLHAASPGGATSAVALDDDCGFGCFQGQLDITEEGHWTFAARAVTNREPIAAEFRLPLPSADGRVHLERAIRATETARMHETLRATLDAEGIVSDYQFAAPNAMRYAIRGGGSIVFLGGTRYRRDEASDRWHAEEAFAGFTWPAGYYRNFWTPAAAVRVVGREVLDGTPTDVVAFLRPDISAWFRIWMGEDDGIVRQMEMRAQGHLMDQTYRALNEPRHPATRVNDRRCRGVWPLLFWREPFSVRCTPFGAMVCRSGPWRFAPHSGPSVKVIL